MNFALNNEPDVYQVTFRINQLNIIYEKAAVRAYLCTTLAGFDSSQKDLSIHIVNLINTFNYETIKESLILCGLGDTIPLQARAI